MLNIEFEIKVRSALCIGSTADVQTIGVDKVTTRDSEGRLIIPASTIKGKLRSECEKILRGLNIEICMPPAPETTCPNYWGIPEQNNQRYCAICKIFGSPWRRSSLYFSDAHLEDSMIASSVLKEMRRFDSQVRPGVSISRRRRTTEAERLFFTEVTLPKADFVFKGEIKGELNSEKYLTLLAAGLKSIIALGGGKSRGLGWTKITLKKVKMNGKTFKEDEILQLMEELKEW